MKTSENIVLVVREHPTDTDYLRWTVQTLGGEIVEDRLTYGQAVSRRDRISQSAYFLARFALSKWSRAWSIKYTTLTLWSSMVGTVNTRLCRTAPRMMLRCCAVLTLYLSELISTVSLSTNLAASKCRP